MTMSHNSPELPATSKAGRNYLIRFARAEVRVYHDPAKPGNSVSEPALRRLINDGLVHLGPYHPLQGRLIEVTDLGRAVLGADGGA